MEYGGIERVVLMLDRVLTEAGHEVVTIALEGSWLAGGLVTAAGHEEQVRVALVLAPGFDVVQVHRREFLSLGAASVVRRDFPGTRVVATLHGAPGPVSRHYGAYGGLASFVFVSRAQASGVPGLAGTVVLNAVATGAVPFSPAPASPPYLAFLGRISPDKGVAEAVGLAGAAGMPLRIAGVVLDHDRAYFEDVVSPLLRAGQAELAGPVRDGAKWGLLGGAAGMVLLPNYEDPCPVAAIESLAAGTPVLTLARGGLPELVDDGVTGLVAADVPALAARAGELAGLSRRECRAAAAARFDEGRLARDYLAVYQGAGAAG